MSVWPNSRITCTAVRTVSISTTPDGCTGHRAAVRSKAPYKMSVAARFTTHDTFDQFAAYLVKRIERKLSWPTLVC